MLSFHAVPEGKVKNARVRSWSMTSSYSGICIAKIYQSESNFYLRIVFRCAHSNVSVVIMSYRYENQKIMLAPDLNVGGGSLDNLGLNNRGYLKFSIYYKQVCIN